MDTKLKNKRKSLLYVVIIMLLFSYGLGGTLELAGEAPYRLRGSYFNTSEFEAELQDFMNLFAQTQLEYIDIETAKQNIEIDPSEIEEYRDYNNQTMEEEIAKIESEEIMVSEETENIQPEEEKNNKIEAIKEEYTQTEDEIRGIIREKKVKELEEQYNEINAQISRFNYKQSYIKYSIQDSAGKTYTNLMENESFDTVKNSSFFSRYFPYHTKRNDILASINHFFITRDLTGFIAIPKSEQIHSLVVENMYDYQDETIQFLILFGVSFVVLILSLILGLNYKKKYWENLLEILEPLKEVYNKIPIDIRMGAALLNFLFIYTFYSPVVYGLYRLRIFRFLFYSGSLAALMIQIIFLLPVLRSGQIMKTEWKKSFILKQKGALTGSFVFKSPIIMILFILGIVFGLGGIAGVALVEFSFEEVLIIAFIILICGMGVLIYILRKLSYFNSILHYSEDIIEGKAVNGVFVKKRGLLARLARNLNQMKTGIDDSQKVQLKSERLKTELISNVSHDLRTPLTSIMNYTEFLKNKELSEQEREEYIEIIDQKSKRLKVLIEDLFEVSKMASGNIELSMEKVDIVQLMNQALAEYDEKIKESGLDFKVTSSGSHIYAWVDGRKMWRVFDNIISNILKYSLEKTRVYISINEADTNIAITFKNISNYELGENIEELLERFKRGDSSRHTEGSGLGLAIAKSIVDHHKGSLDIELDGDLFKTIVKINK